MVQHNQGEKERVETVHHTKHDPDAREGDHDEVISDPARNDKDGSDWTDEGGATPDGPAT